MSTAATTVPAVWTDRSTSPATTDRSQLSQPTKRQARLAGAFYLLCALTAPFGLIYVPSVLIVRGDAAATAANIRADEMLFRGGIAVGLFSMVAFLFAVLALYRLLCSVDKVQAALMAILGAFSLPISLVSAATDLVTLNLLHRADLLTALGARQLDAVAVSFLSLGGPLVAASELFWGLWLLPFGVLVMRSRFLPRILGVLLVVNGVAYVVLSFTAILLPEWSPIVAKAAFPAELGELWIMLWLAIRGIDERAVPASARG
jgi:uncharacterized protein DUF4386